MNGLYIFFLLLFVLFLALFIWMWYDKNEREEKRRILIDETDILWIYIISPSPEQRKSIRESLYMKYDLFTSVYRQLHRKRFDNLIKYSDDYSNNVEVLTKLDPYVKEIEVTNDLIKKSTGCQLCQITSLTLTMIRYLKEDNYNHAIQSRDAILNLIHLI